MSIPHLYSPLQAQLSQWIHPQAQRHLQAFCENVAALLQTQSASLSYYWRCLMLVKVACSNEAAIRVVVRVRDLCTATNSRVLRVVHDVIVVEVR